MIAQAKTMTPIDGIDHLQGWYLAYTKPRQEEVARINLEQQKLHGYLPLFKKLGSNEQGAFAVYEPMFPRYIFFRPSHAEQSITTVRSTRGVTSLVRFGFEPAVMAEELLQVVRDLEQSRSLTTLEELSGLRAGQKVRLRHSALSGLEGLVSQVSGKRVAVLLEILGRPTEVQLEHHQLEPVQH